MFYFCLAVYIVYLPYRCNTIQAQYLLKMPDLHLLTIIFWPPQILKKYLKIVSKNIFYSILLWSKIFSFKLNINNPRSIYKMSYYITLILYHTLQRFHSENNLILLKKKVEFQKILIEGFSWHYRSSLHRYNISVFLLILILWVC